MARVWLSDQAAAWREAQRQDDSWLLHDDPVLVRVGDQAVLVHVDALEVVEDVNGVQTVREEHCALWDALVALSGLETFETVELPAGSGRRYVLYGYAYQP